MRLFWQLACTFTLQVSSRDRAATFDLHDISEHGVAFPLFADKELVAAVVSQLDFGHGIGAKGLIDIHHLQSANGTAMLRLGTSHALVAAAAEALQRFVGNYSKDLALISSDLFCKPPGQQLEFIGWHQDQSWWNVSPLNGLVNCWVAFDTTSAANSCVRYVLESHAGGLQKHTAQVPGNQLLFSVEVPEAKERSAVCAQLQPAEFAVFSGLTVHSSPPNSGTSRRCGAVFRYTTWPPQLSKYELHGEPYWPKPIMLLDESRTEL
eukprot:TRINITY_DN106093_c0_g1_i1.p1 TRINITY_DN106093_c0_g1~~TRINITY_DN106093_c0_g1_i1.p1  ORF type:complete len:265 (-),score=40.37 TRINITY_DN106093_c0_g1_i1:265-1059(-)